MATPLVNGNFYSFASVEISIGGQTYTGVAAVDYDDELKPGEVRANMAEIVGRTLGQHTASGSIEVYKASWNTIAQAIAAKSQLPSGSPDGQTIGTVYFDVIVNYADVGAPVITDKLEACRITKVGNSHKQGPEALTVKLDLSVQRINHNGLYLAPRPNLTGAQ